MRIRSFSDAAEEIRKLRKDFDRYRNSAGWVSPEVSLIVIVHYRLLRALMLLRMPLISFPILLLTLPSYYFWRVFSGITIPINCRIGGGLRIYHFGGIVLNGGVVIGMQCTFRHNVTLGNRSMNGGVPIVGDFVEFGVGSIVIGPVNIGNRCVIGAGAVVLQDLPDGSTAVGNPARTIARNLRK